MSSSIAFLSSPLQSNYPSGHFQSSFRIPQQHRSHSFKPTSPSPLQTSRNANVMFNALSQSDDSDKEPLKTSRSQFDGGYDGGPFFFLNEQSTTEPRGDVARATRFQYESRARSSSPSVQLQSHMTANRDSRKKVFLNRLRNQRDDARFERNGEYILRMDWLNERKAWEHKMAQKVVEHEDLEMEDEGEDFPMDQDAESDAGNMSPTEEKELEELVSYYDEPQDDCFDDAEDDYDALFMEVLSQQGGSGDLTTTHARDDVKADVEMG